MLGPFARRLGGVARPSLFRPSVLGARCFGGHDHHHHYTGPKSPGLVGKPGHLEEFPQAVDSHDPSDPYGVHGARHHIGSDSVSLNSMTKYRTYSFHLAGMDDAPVSKFKTENGQKFIVGEEVAPLAETFHIPQTNIPIHARRRMDIWANDDVVGKAEFIFFYIPMCIVAALAIPAFAMIYMQDDAVYATMTVKVIGRQWYWVYEVESPVDGDEEDEE